jgi:hypothetical protein
MGMDKFKNFNSHSSFLAIFYLQHWQDGHYSFDRLGI